MVFNITTVILALGLGSANAPSFTSVTHLANAVIAFDEHSSGASQVKNYPKNAYLEQDAKQGPLSQFQERAGNGLHACSSSEELHGLSVRA